MEEKKIDLIEVFKIINSWRIFILSFVSFFVIIALVYLSLKTPVYEGKATIKVNDYLEVFFYDNRSNNITTGRTPVVDHFVLLEKIKQYYLNQKISNTTLTYIDNHPNIEGYFNIRLQSTSNKDLKKFITEMLIDISKDLNKKPGNLLEINRIEKNKFDKKIYKIKHYILGLNKKVSTINSILKKQNKILTQLSLKNLNKKIEYLGDISTNEYQLFLIKKELDEVEALLDTYVSRSAILEKAIDALQHKKVTVINKIIISSKPIKPNKVRIMLLAVVGSLFLALFLLPFLHILRTNKSK